MTTGLLKKPSTVELPRIVCGKCAQALPLRMAGKDEQPAVWQCAQCSMTYTGVCIKDELIKASNSIRFNQRYFDTSGCTPISNKVRQQATNIANRPISQANKIKRRSARIKQSLLVSGITLSAGLNPIGVSLQLMVFDISKEGIGLASTSAIFAPFIAIELPHNDNKSNQLVIKVVKESIFELPLHEYGCEFYMRLGNNAS